MKCESFGTADEWKFECYASIIAKQSSQLFQSYTENLSNEEDTTTDLGHWKFLKVLKVQGRSEKCKNCILVNWLRDFDRHEIFLPVLDFKFALRI